MKLASLIVLLLVTTALPMSKVAGRSWADSSGQYTLDAELVAFDSRVVVLRRADSELVTIPLETLSEEDREFLKSTEAIDLNRKAIETTQTWTLQDGTKIEGRLVDFAERDLTIQRRRGRIYVNDRVFDNLPDFYQKLVPAIVAQLEKLPRATRRTFDAWVLRQRGRPRTFALEGVVLETKDGEEFAIPFLMLTADDMRLFQAGWDEWRAHREKEDFEAQADCAFLLQSLAAARYEDARVQRDIAKLQLKLQAVQVGLTSLWEVTLYPPANLRKPPRWVVVPGRDSRQATLNALEDFPNYVVGPVRRVSRR